MVSVAFFRKKLGWQNFFLHMAIMGGREAKTTWKRVVYQRGRAIRIILAMEDVMAAMGWFVVLLVCKRPS